MRDTETHGQRQQKINQTQNFASLLQKNEKLYKLKIYLTLRYTGGGHNGHPQGIYALVPSRLI